MLIYAIIYPVFSIEKERKITHEHLSARELEVFKFITSGKTVSEIANLLSITVATTATYRARILKKLNLKNNAELTHFAFSQGII